MKLKNSKRTKGGLRPARAQRNGSVTFKRVLVPTDFSAESLKAVHFATEFAKRFGASIRLLHVVEPPSVIQESVIAAALLSSKELARDAQTRLQAWARDEIDEMVPVQTEARVGKPYVEIAAAAKVSDTDLIIIATHGHTGLKHVLLGSTAERVVQHSPCPVLVVRGS